MSNLKSCHNTINQCTHPITCYTRQNHIDPLTQALLVHKTVHKAKTINTNIYAVQLKFHNAENRKYGAALDYNTSNMRNR